MMQTRQAEVNRKTKETDIQCALNLDGGGALHGGSGAAFFDHMLEQVVRHGGLDVTLQVAGDLHIDAHHTIEDCGIVLGQALRQALGDKAGITRFGFAYAPLDEALARAVVDISGRSSLVYQVAVSRQSVGDVDSDLFREFFQALVNHAQISVHLDLIRGVNAHHQIESVFKSFGLALAQAKALRGDGAAVPSTKGCL